MGKKTSHTKQVAKSKNHQKTKKQFSVPTLIIALMVTLLSSILFVGAAAGWFSDPKTTLDPEYYGDYNGFTELSKEDYENLIANQKSFLVFVDQPNCTTADHVRDFIENWSKDSGVKPFKIMFETAKETPLHDSVKYYPSVAIISKGRVVGFLRADSDEDAPAYNDYQAFLEWLSKYL